MLTDTEIRKTKPQDKPFKMTDGKGLYLLVNPNGGKLWRFDYRHGGKRKTLAIGVYPETGLAKARERLEDARRLLADGIDPMADRKSTKEGKAERAKNSFEAVAREWLALNVGKRAKPLLARLVECKALAALDEAGTALWLDEGSFIRSLDKGKIRA